MNQQTVDDYIGSIEAAERKLKNHEQVKCWSLSRQLKLHSEGWKFLVKLPAHYKPWKRAEESASMDAHQHQQVPLVYGFHLLARILSTNPLSAGLGFMFEFEPNSYISSIASTLFYLTGLGSIIVAFVLSQIVFHTIIEKVLSGVVKGIVDLLGAVFKLSILFYSVYGGFTFMWLTYNRKFLQNFVQNGCSHLLVPKKFQLETIASILVENICFGLLLEPLLGYSTLIENFHQPRFLPSLTPEQFETTKITVASIILYGASNFCLVASIVPMMNCFMIIVTAKFIEIQSSKLIFRFESINSESQDIKPSQLIDHCSAELVEQYFVESIFSCWPQIDQKEKPDSKSINVAQAMRPAGNFIFLYRNLLQVLQELRLMIKSYQQVFGYFHITQIAQRGLTVAIWVFFGQLELRMDRTGSYKTADDPHNSFGWLNSITARLVLCVGVFVTSNALMFHRCSRVENQMKKLTVRLFSINVKLATYSEMSTNEVELQLAWLLYDQVKRLSRELNYKFMGNMMYNNRCLIWVLSREISFILLFIQVADLYSNS